MDAREVRAEINHDRRRFLGAAGAAALAVAAGQLGTTGSAQAQTGAAGAAGLSAFGGSGSLLAARLVIRYPDTETRALTRSGHKTAMMSPVRDPQS